MPRGAVFAGVSCAGDWAGTARNRKTAVAVINRDRVFTGPLLPGGWLPPTASNAKTGVKSGNVGWLFLTATGQNRVTLRKQEAGSIHTGALWYELPAQERVYNRSQIAKGGSFIREIS